MGGISLFNFASYTAVSKNILFSFPLIDVYYNLIFLYVKILYNPHSDIRYCLLYTVTLLLKLLAEYIIISLNNINFIFQYLYIFSSS